MDTIEDLEIGLDKIDLSAIDANTAFGGDQAFILRLDAATFSGKRGELLAITTAQYDAGGVVRQAVQLYGDIDGDRSADFRLEVHTVGGVLSAADFVL